ncbi:MAG: GNVR domain-containing protein, partial [Desulforhabdus sp.]|nr:GNVR domain-containing protein [Desulforhabdus sp.]
LPILSYESQSPKLAQEVLQKLIDNYLDEHIRAYRTTGSYKFFDQQTEQLRTDLAATESRLKDLKNETGTASIEDQRRILLERIGDLQRELETAKSAAAASVAKIETFQKTLAVVPQKLMTEEVTGSANSAVDELRKRINDLQLKENELLSTFTETSVPVTEIRRQIKEARSLLRNTQQTREVTQGVNLTYQQIESDLLKEQGNLSSLRAKAETLQDQLADSQVELKNINEAEIQLAQLQRDVETQQVNYRKYSESLEQARIDQALEMEKISNISVVQFASFPVQPIRPRIMLNLVLGFFLGIFGGFGLAFLTEYLDRSFAKPEDIEEKLGLPVIASLPIMNPDLRMGIADLSPATVPQIHRGGLPAALNLDELEVYESCLELVSQSDSFATEPQPGAAHVIAITSCRQGEGVSTVAAQLSITLARRNTGRILLVDANFGHPTLSQIFGMETNSGLADILVGGNGNTAPNRPSFCDGLDILCSGHKDCDLSSPKASQAFTNLLHLWKREYNFVVIDSPPFDQQGAAIITGDLADSVLLVIEAEGVRWEVAQRALKRLKKAKSNVIGAILNKRRYYIPDWLYRRL